MKLLIVDDHPVVRQGLAALLQQIEPGTQVLTAGDASEGLILADRDRDLDAVILDLSMPGLSGAEAIKEFGKCRPEVPVVVLSSSEEPQDVRYALAAGALGYVPKSASPETMLSALRLVLTGNVYVPPLMLRTAEATAKNGGTDARGAEAASLLTGRQVDVLKAMCRGLSNKEIGRELALSEKTVKAHITAIFKALRVINRGQAVVAAKEAELV